jgi:hypothetical protein
MCAEVAERARARDPTRVVPAPRRVGVDEPVLKVASPDVLDLPDLFRLGQLYHVPDRQDKPIVECRRGDRVALASSGRHLLGGVEVVCDRRLVEDACARLEGRGQRLRVEAVRAEVVEDIDLVDDVCSVGGVALEGEPVNSVRERLAREPLAEESDGNRHASGPVGAARLRLEDGSRERVDDLLQPLARGGERVLVFDRECAFVPDHPERRDDLLPVGLFMTVADRPEQPQPIRLVRVGVHIQISLHPGVRLIQAGVLGVEVMDRVPFAQIADRLGDFDPLSVEV